MENLSAFIIIFFVFAIMLFLVGLLCYKDEEGLTTEESTDLLCLSATVATLTAVVTTLL